MTSQFSPKVSEILAFSREEANRLASKSVGPEHLLLGILRGKSGPVIDLFRRLEINIQKLKAELEQRVKEEITQENTHISEIALNEQANNILKLAVLEARIQHTQLVDVQHLLLAILHDQVANGAKVALENNQLDYETALQMLQKKPTADGLGLPDEDEEYEDDAMASQHNAGNSRQSTTTTKKQGATKTPVLDNFSTNP